MDKSLQAGNLSPSPASITSCFLIHRLVHPPRKTGRRRTPRTLPITRHYIVHSNSSRAAIPAMDVKFVTALETPESLPLDFAMLAARRHASPKRTALAKLTSAPPLQSLSRFQSHMGSSFRMYAAS